MYLETAYRPEDLKIERVLHFHCDSFHHLALLPNDLCATVYQIACKLSHESEVFRASARHLAEDLACSEKSIQRAIRLLRNTGWFMKVRSPRIPGRYSPNAYMVWTHAEWAKHHPGLCGKKRLPSPTGKAHSGAPEPEPVGLQSPTEKGLPSPTAIELPSPTKYESEIRVLSMNPQNPLFRAKEGFCLRSKSNCKSNGKNSDMVKQLQKQLQLPGSGHGFTW